MEILSIFTENLFVSLLIWGVGFIAIKFVLAKILFKILRKTKIKEDFHVFIIQSIKIICYIFIAVSGINTLGIHPLSAATLLGSVAIAVILSLKGSLTAVGDGVLLHIAKPFKKGDYISVNDFKGEVVSVTPLYTKILLLDNRVVMLPNGKLTEANIENRFINEMVRVDVDFTVPYGTHLENMMDTMKETMLANKYVIKEKGVTTVVPKFDAEGFHVSNRSWCKSKDYWDALYSMREDIIQAIKENRIETADSLSVDIENMVHD